jgi:hypothetical protein
MSSVPGVSSSSGVEYATQLAQSSALKRGLFNLGNAVQNGDLNSAGSIYNAFVKANPQYSSTSSDASQSSAPINKDFQALADAISNNQVDTAKSAWTQIKSDLAKSGVTDLSDGKAATAELLAANKASISQQIVSNAFGTSPGVGLSVTSLLAEGSSSGTDATSSVFSNWLTYQAVGNASAPTPPASTGNILNTAA